MEWRGSDIGGMLCSHSERASPLIRYRERGSTVRVKRSQPEPTRRLKRNGQLAPPRAWGLKLLDPQARRSYFAR